MVRNYLKIAVRALWRSKAHSSINILGLSLGTMCCILITLFVRDEWTYDTFHSKADRIYRVYAKENWGENQEFFNTVTPFPMGPALKDNIPEVEKQVRINTIYSIEKVGENQYSDPIAIGGQDFFDVFDFELLQGDRASALRSQSAVILTESIAEKYFGKSTPMGQTISIQLGDIFEEFTVKGVLKDLPTNSSIRFQILVSDLNYPRLYNERVLTSAWFNINPETYVLLQEGVAASAVEAKFPSLFRTILGEEDYTASHYQPGLQPITSIHLDTSFPAGASPTSDSRYSYILAAIALLILFVACINFVTLSIGRSLKRSKEVGIRKVVGAERRQLIFQFIGEALVVTTLSLSIGLALAVVGLPFFNDLSGKQLVFPWNGFLAMLMITLLTIVGLIAGSYPAFFLSSFNPVRILKGGATGNAKLNVRRVLVGLQLVLSIFLISSTLIMREQLNFLRTRNLGFDKEQLVVVPLNVPKGGRMGERIRQGFERSEPFKAELAKLPDVVAVSASSHDFGDGAWTSIGYTDDNGTYRTFNANIVDEQYIPTLQMVLSQGRNFDAANPSDKRRSIIVNEAFVKEYGWNDPLGKRIPGKGFEDHEIIGVVKDFNYASLYTKVGPLVLVQDPVVVLSGSENINFDNSPWPKLLIRLSEGNITSGLDGVETVWKNLVGDQEFIYSFVDQSLDAQYKSDLNLGKIVSVATLLSILIGSMGLYGLASLAMQNRTREISIRKVLGATEQSLLVLLSKEYVYLVVICLAISVPVTIYLMSGWLQSFQYRIEITTRSFVWAGLLSIAIAFIAIAYEAVRTAWAQPAQTLKSE